MLERAMRIGTHHRFTLEAVARSFHQLPGSYASDFRQRLRELTKRDGFIHRSDDTRLLASRPLLQRGICRYHQDRHCRPALAGNLSQVVPIELRNTEVRQQYI